MNKSSSPTLKLKPLQHVLIVTGVTFACFFIGGGWQFNLSDFPAHRAQGDDLLDDIFSYLILFYYRGGVAAVAGGLLTTVALFLMERRKKTSPSQEL